MLPKPNFTGLLISPYLNDKIYEKQKRGNSCTGSNAEQEQENDDQEIVIFIQLPHVHLLLLIEGGVTQF